MNFKIFFVILLFWISLIHAKVNGFCYDDDSEDPDCPGPSQWGRFCNKAESQRQSPIVLPKTHTPSNIPRSVTLHTSAYHGSSFRMQNNGHYLAITFPIVTNAAGISPTALLREEARLYSKYSLDSGHFHWGRNDMNGSEHCLETAGCFAMELHLVHFKSDYDSLENAIASGDPDAISVVAIMFEVAGKAGDDGNRYLAPIVNAIVQVTEPSHDWVSVPAVLDFRSFLNTAVQGNHYTYKGSLTTPDCNENVNWYVFDNPVAVSRRDLETFRSIMNDRGNQLTNNVRPLQPRNGRGVYLASIRQL